MKTLAKLSLVVLAVLAIASCGDKANTPEAVAEKFLNHLNKQEYAEAKALGTEATGQMIDMMASFAEMDPEAEVEEVEITEMTCETKEETAHCTYKSDGKEESIDLVNQDGKWLVDMKKETPADDAMDETLDEMEEELDDVVEELEETVEELEEEIAE